MQGKSRVMAAVAAGALVVALGAGAARCAIAPQEGAQDSPQEQEQPAAAGADVATGKAASGAEALWNTAWTGADDPTATLRIVEGAMAESAGGTERAWFFSAEEPSEAGGVLSVPIDVKGTGDKAGGLSLIQVSGDGDNRILACDLLTQALDWQPLYGHLRQRLSPAFLNSTGLMYPSFECSLKLLYQWT